MNLDLDIVKLDLDIVNLDLDIVNLDLDIVNVDLDIVKLYLNIVDFKKNDGIFKHFKTKKNEKTIFNDYCFHSYEQPSLFANIFKGRKGGFLQGIYEGNGAEY